MVVTVAGDVWCGIWWLRLVWHLVATLGVALGGIFGDHFGVNVWCGIWRRCLVWHLVMTFGDHVWCGIW